MAGGWLTLRVRDWLEAAWVHAAGLHTAGVGASGRHVCVWVAVIFAKIRTWKLEANNREQHVVRHTGGCV